MTPKKSVKPTLMTSPSKLKALGDAVGKNIRERSDVVRGFQLALLTGENMLLLGKPGLAKSAIAREVCYALGGKFFEILLDKQMPKDEVVGAVSPEQLMQGKFVRNTDGSIQTADVAFLDEIFKCNSSTLNSLLSIMNERVFTERGVAKKLPLQTVVAASNELPEAKELGAFDDRMVIRFEVQPIQEEANFIDMVTGAGRVTVPEMSLAELSEEQAKVNEVKDSDDAIQALVKLRRAFQDAGLYISDRKWKKAYRIAKANAHLEGRDTVTADDLLVLDCVLWSNPEQYAEVKKIISKTVNPIAAKITEQLDLLRSLANDWKRNPSTNAKMEVGIKVGEIVDTLSDLGDATKNEKLAEAIEYGNELRMNILNYRPGKKV